MVKDPQRMLSAHIPWYRKRGFWGGVFVLMLLLSVYNFTELADTSNGNYELSASQLFDFFNLSFGAAGFYLGGFDLMPQYGGLFGSVVYWVIIGFLVFKTFEYKTTKLRYPISVVVLYATGIVAVAMLLFGF